MCSCFRKELLTISAAVMGIEFAYAAETAFVSPTLLKIGGKFTKNDYNPSPTS